MTEPKRPPSGEEPLSDDEYKSYMRWRKQEGPIGWLATAIIKNESGIRSRSDYQAWVREGRPGHIAEISPRTRELMETPEFAEVQRRREESQAALAMGEEPKAEPKKEEDPYKVVRVEVVQEGGYDYEVSFNAAGESLGMTRIGPSRREDEGVTAAEVGRERLGWEREQYGQISESERRERATREREAAKGRQFTAATATRQAQWEEEAQTRQLDWYRQQAMMEQQEQERQHMAQLAAQPISWLQYAAYTGQQPVVQPWMQPLMPQQYGMEAGQPIPGWTPESGQGMPELTRPSAQLWSRMGPSQQQQYQGYKQARTGASPADVDWRRRAAAPPGGRGSRLSWMR